MTAQAHTLDIGPIQDQLHNDESSRGAATVTTMNFVVYINEAQLSGRAHEKAGKLAEKYPARVILLNAGTREVILGAHGPIELGIAEASPQSVCSAINALRVPDVSNVLWWTAAAVLQQALLDELLPLMDTVIVDSSGLTSAEATVRELCHFLSTQHDAVLRDLAYLRLAPWQDMVAQFFDDEAFVADLHRIERVEITSGSAAEGYYLVGWLAGRLGWTPCGASQLCDRDGRAIVVKFARDGGLRRVLRVALATPDSMFSAELSESDDTVCLSVAGPNTRPPRCAPLHDVDNMSLLEKAFLIPARDEVFESSLRVLSNLFEYDR